MSGGGKGGGSQTIGYEYYFDMHMGLGRGPVDEIVAMKAADLMAWQGSITENGPSVRINAPDLFGGNKKEGGINGYFGVLMGNADQVVTSALLPGVFTPGITPSFRGMVTVVFSGMIGAMNPYPKKWAWRVRRALKGWDGDPLMPATAVIAIGAAPPAGPAPTDTNPDPPPSPPSWPYAPLEFEFYIIARSQWEKRQKARDLAQQASLIPVTQIKAMNPAHIIYECLTNRPWGRGLDRSVINTASFEQAASTLYAENFGMCLRWTRQDEIQSFIQSIMDTIGATLYTDRSTALLTLKLIRGDYVREDLPLYTTSNGILEINEASYSTASGALNEVIINYRDPVSNAKKSVRTQNLASLQSSNGQFKSKTIEYKGVPTSWIALRLAQRELRSNAEGIRRFRFTMDRRGWRITPGSVIRIEDPLRLIPDTVVRVARVEDGTLLNGKIVITAVQDVFSMPATTFAEEEPDRYVPPLTNACVGKHKVFELPYVMLVRNTSAADFQTISSTSAYIGVVADQGTNKQNVAYDTAVRTSAITLDDWPATDDSYCGYEPPP